MNDNKGAHNTGYSFILAVKETFSKFRRTKPLNFKYAQTKIGEFLKKNQTWKRKPNQIETDEGKDNVDKMLKEFLKQNDFQRYSRYTSGGAVFAE